MSEYRTSEWVSTGHPDKMADYISSYILDRYLEKDPMTRYALEVMIKDNVVVLGGEITSRAEFSDHELIEFARAAVNEIGYTAEYQRIWGAENTICGDELLGYVFTSRQSPDIAQGVDQDGFGDQGIFWGMAENNTMTNYMPLDWWYARRIGKHLYDTRYAGLDIKTQVTMNGDKIEDITIAIPMNHRHFESDIAAAVAYCLDGNRDYSLHINGTGKFLRHGPIGDCGVTGRKLAVDFYGGNCRIGVGCPWTKDGTKADLTLNLTARQWALTELTTWNDLEKAYCSISCRIGSPEILYEIYDEHMEMRRHDRFECSPEILIERFNLRKPIFAEMCRNGLFMGNEA